MGKKTTKLVLTKGSIIEIIGGPHRNLHGEVRAKVLEVIGSPTQKRTVRVKIDGEEVLLEQRHIRVVANPFGWLTSMNPEYTELPAVPKYGNRAYQKPSLTAKQSKIMAKANADAKRGKGRKPRTSRGRR